MNQSMNRWCCSVRQRLRVLQNTDIFLFTGEFTPVCRSIPFARVGWRDHDIVWHNISRSPDFDLVWTWYRALARKLRIFRSAHIMKFRWIYAGMNESSGTPRFDLVWAYDHMYAYRYEYQCYVLFNGAKWECIVRPSFIIINFYSRLYVSKIYPQYVTSQPAGLLDTAVQEYESTRFPEVASAVLLLAPIWYCACESTYMATTGKAVVPLWL